MRFIRSTYAAAVLDFGRHVSVAALDSLTELDTLYLLTTLELDTLDHAKDCLLLLEQRGFPMSRVRVLLNRVPERGAPDPKGMEDYLGVPFAGRFTADNEVLSDAWSEGRLLEANTKLGRELYSLAGSMVARVRGESEAPKSRPQPARASGGVGRLFSFWGNRK